MKIRKHLAHEAVQNGHLCLHCHTTVRVGLRCWNACDRKVIEDLFKPFHVHDLLIAFPVVLASTRLQPNWPRSTHYCFNRLVDIFTAVNLWNARTADAEQCQLSQQGVLSRVQRDYAVMPHTGQPLLFGDGGQSTGCICKQNLAPVRTHSQAARGFLPRLQKSNFGQELLNAED
jgi:hypothetical protein